jgi:predicted TIM-barrel fold metal-dependent hydrolase
MNRRRFLARSSTLALTSPLLAASVPPAAEPIIDIHQHTDYHDRSNQHLLLHQRAMGITTTILLPSGTYIARDSTHSGKSNGLAAGCSGFTVCADFAKAHPGEFFTAANEITDAPFAPQEIERQIKAGAVMIAEQKFAVPCDSEASQRLYAIAAEYQVPILMHFQLSTYNFGYDRLHLMLEKYPHTTFIGHAQTVWGNIDKAYDWKNNYPKGKVTPGGLTDRYLADYPNFYADMSAGSGLNALQRDEEHTRLFLAKHQEKILYGSDCADHFGRGPGCQGAQTLAMIRKCAPDKAAERKILFDNSKRVFRLPGI